MTEPATSVLINGKAIGLVDISDRGLSYGDGVFETMLQVGDTVPFLDRHLSRLERACAILGIAAPERSVWHDDIQKLKRYSDDSKSVVKLTLTRGKGGRGYAPPEQADPTRIVQVLAYPDTSNAESLTCAVLSAQLGSSPMLGGIKHLNRLEQVMAAQELAKRNLDEGFLCNHYGFLIEAVSSNVILVVGDTVITPKLDTSGVRGIMRDYLIEQLSDTPFAIQKEFVYAETLELADEIILCNSVRGVQRVGWFGSRQLNEGKVFATLKAIAKRGFGELD